MFGETFEYDNNIEKKNDTDKKSPDADKETEKKTPKTKAEITKDQINRRQKFLEEDPNDANPKDNKKPTRTKGFAEAMEAGVGGITEKKIPGYKRTLKDGSEVEVVSGEDSFSVTISKGSGKNKDTLHIYLSNFKKKGLYDKNNNINNDEKNQNSEYDKNNEKYDKSMPDMRISGNIKLLDKHLNAGAKEKPAGDNVNLNIGDQYDVAKIVESIEENIMRVEREDVHGIKDHEDRKEKERIDEKKNNYDLLLTELSNDFNTNPPATNEEIAKYVIDINATNFDNKLQYLSERQMVLALCKLFERYSIQEITQMILGNKEINIQKSATIRNPESGENVVEYLKTLDGDFLVKIEEKVINLALNSNNISDEEKTFLQS